MGKVRFEYFGSYNTDGKLCFRYKTYDSTPTGDYYPAEDYEALQAKLAALVKAAKVVFGRVEFTKNYPVYDRVDSILESIDRLKAALNAAKEG